MAALFRKSDVSRDALNTDIGRRPERPFQILGISAETTVGDLIANTVFFSTLADQFDHARLHVKFRDVRPYVREILSLSPWIDQSDPLPGEWPAFVRQFFPLAKPWRGVELGKFKGGNELYYDLVVTNQMASVNTVHALPNPVRLSIPKARTDSLSQELVAQGLRPDRWYAVFHYRESSYEFRPKGGDRDGDATAFQDLARHIIALGGQAVRLGHPGMTPFPPMDGFVDLSVLPDSFMVQAAAASHARFMIGGPSGMIALGWAFGIPNTLVDAADSGGLWGESIADILTHEVITPSGVSLRNAALLGAGLLDRSRLQARMTSEPGWKVRKANGEELGQVAARLHARSMDCNGWREAPIKLANKKPNMISLPLQTTYPMPWCAL